MCCAVCLSVCLSVRQPASQSVSLSIGNEYNLACMLSVTASSMPVGIGRRRDDRSMTVRATTLVLTSKSFSSMQKAFRSRGAQLPVSYVPEVQTRPQGGGPCSCRHLWYGYICKCTHCGGVSLPCERFKPGAHQAPSAVGHTRRALPKQQETGSSCGPGIVSVNPDDQRKLERSSI